MTIKKKQREKTVGKEENEVGVNRKVKRKKIRKKSNMERQIRK